MVKPHSTNAYHEYLQSDAWKSLRLLCLQRDGHRCRICNSKEDLEIHHRTYDRFGHEDVEDLTTLCHRCHELYTEKSIIGGDSVGLGQCVQEAWRALDKRRFNGQTRNFSGISTGFVDLDNLTAGLQDNELIVIGSRPGVGKTTFALNIARHVAVEEGLPVLYVSLVETRIDLAWRLLCCQARVDSHRIRSGRLTSDDDTRILEAGAVLADAKLYIEDAPGNGLLRVIASARRAKDEQGVRLVIIDHLKAIGGDGFRFSREEQAAGISRRLKLLARELEVPIIALSQVSRNSEDRTDHRPRLSDLRESGAIEHEADTVMMLHRPDYHEPGQHEGLVEVIVVKQRNGPTGEVVLMYAKQSMRFENFAVEDSIRRG